MPEFFRYGPDQMAYLSQRDPILGEAIERIGPIKREVTPDLFEALMYMIIAQQVSVKAAKTVYGRLRARCLDLTPQTSRVQIWQVVQFLID